jgi:metal-responsive CopG/Arc/MetJ family transcriptional regulator
MMNDNVIMRTIVDLPLEQVAVLGKYCESAGISRAEAVRRAVTQFLETHADENREKAFGSWMKTDRNSTSVVRCIREEWPE